jgi:hypothetical protein
VPRCADRRLREASAGRAPFHNGWRLPVPQPFPFHGSAGHPGSLGSVLRWLVPRAARSAGMVGMAQVEAAVVDRHGFNLAAGCDTRIAATRVGPTGSRRVIRKRCHTTSPVFPCSVYDVTINGDPPDV